MASAEEYFIHEDFQDNNGFKSIKMTCFESQMWTTYYLCEDESMDIYNCSNQRIFFMLVNDLAGSMHIYEISCFDIAKNTLLIHAYYECDSLLSHIQTCIWEFLAGFCRHWNGFGWVM